MKIFNFELGIELDQYFDVKFDEESEFDSFGHTLNNSNTSEYGVHASSKVDIR